MNKNKKVNICQAEKPIKSNSEFMLRLFKFKKSNKDNTRERIKSLIEEINDKYSYEKCLLIVGVPEEIPDSLYELLVGRGINGLSVCNLDEKYLDYLGRKYDAYEFMCDVEALFSALAREFDTLVEFFFTGKIEDKEVNYERT